MNGKEIVKEIMKNKNESNKIFADKLKISPSALCDRLKTDSAKDLSVTTLKEMLLLLDYEIQIVPINSKLPTGGYKVK